MENTFAKQKESDDKIIQSYLGKNNIKAEKTDSGLYYTITKPGSGDHPEKGAIVSVYYTLINLNGQIIESNFDHEPFNFKLGSGMVITGWDEGIALLKKGSKATLYLPSHLAYGSRGAGMDIPPNSVLIFDVELVNIK